VYAYKTLTKPVVKRNGNETRTLGDRDERIIEAAEMTSASLTGYTVLRNINLERREKLKVHSIEEEYYIGRDGNT
jgi:hypothetical protein